ncbi:MbtH family protein [Catenuloplanes indicus]|nr:MbtH family NRPS accessory protein [Catenuloplanes indicus]
MDTEGIDGRIYDVVMNDEEQYSVWPHGTPAPAGWHGTGFSGDEAACLAHIDEVWTDLRPRGLREWLAARS